MLLSKHQFSLRDRIGPHSLEKESQLQASEQEGQTQGRGKKSGSQRAPPGPTGAPEKLGSGGGGQGPKDKGGARVPGGGAATHPRSWPAATRLTSPLPCPLSPRQSYIKKSFGTESFKIKDIVETNDKTGKGSHDYTQQHIVY